MKAAPIAAAPRDASAPGGASPCACRAAADLRCDCGSLLARRVARGVELKCRRCKRTVVLPLADG